MSFHRTGFFGFGGDFFQTVNTPRTEQKLCALRAEGDCRRRAESAGRAGDENPFVFQRRFHGAKNYSEWSDFFSSSLRKRLKASDNLSNKNPTASAHAQPMTTA